MDKCYVLLMETKNGDIKIEVFYEKEAAEENFYNRLAELRAEYDDVSYKEKESEFDITVIMPGYYWEHIRLVEGDFYKE